MSGLGLQRLYPPGFPDLTAIEVLDPAKIQLWCTDEQDPGNPAKKLSLAQFRNYGLEVLSVTDFGAVGDGVADDKDAIQNALDALVAQGGGRLLFPGGRTYLISANVTIAGTDNWEMDLCGSTIKMQDDATVDAGHSILDIASCNYWVVHNGVLDGNKDGGGGRIPDQVPCHNFDVRGCKYFAFHNVHSKNSPVDGWYVAATDDQDPDTFCHHGAWRSCTAMGNSRQGISFINAYDCQVIGGEYSNTDGLAPSAGIDIERNNKIDPPAAQEFTADPLTYYLTTADSVANGTPVRLSSTDTLPQYLEADKTYFVVNSNGSTFQISPYHNGYTMAVGSEGVGTHTITPLDWGWAGLTPSSLAIKIDGAAFRNNSGAGVMIIDDADMVSVEGCYFHGNSQAIKCAGNVVLHKNRFSGNKDVGDGMVELSAPNGNWLGRCSQVTQNTFLGPCADEAINIHGTFSETPVRIEGNEFFEYSRVLVAYETVLFANNVVSRCSSLILNLETGSDSSIVSDNIFKNCEVSTQGMSFEGSGFSVTGNTFTDCILGYVARCYTGTNNLFANNTLTRSDDDGYLLRINSDSEWIVKDNRVEGYRTGGWFYGSDYPVNEVINVRDFGAVGDGVVDDTDAFLDAIAAANNSKTSTVLGAKVIIPQGYYLITSTLSLTGSLQFEGDAIRGSVLHFVPTADDTCIEVGSIDQDKKNSIKNIEIRSSNASYDKIGIHVIDCSETLIDNCYIRFADVSGNLDDVGICVSGRESLTISNCGIAAPVPIYFRDDAAATVGNSDNVSCENLYLIATPAPNTLDHACVLVESTCSLSWVHFTGRQAWAKGEYAMLWNANVSGSALPTVTLENVRHEQADSNSTYSFNFNCSGGTPHFILNNCKSAVECGGLYARNCSVELNGSTIRRNSSQGATADSINVEDVELVTVGTKVSDNGAYDFGTGAQCIHKSQAFTTEGTTGGQWPLVGAWAYPSASDTAPAFGAAGGVATYAHRFVVPSTRRHRVPVISSNGAIAGVMEVVAWDASKTVFAAGTFAIWDGNLDAGGRGTKMLTNTTSMTATPNNAGTFNVWTGSANLSTLYIQNNLGTDVEAFVTIRFHSTTDELGNDYEHTSDIA